MKAILQVFETRSTQPEVERAAPGFENALQAVGAEAETTAETETLSDESTQVSQTQAAVENLSEEAEAAPDAEAAASNLTEANVKAKEASAIPDGDGLDIAEAPLNTEESSGDTSAWRVLQAKTQYNLRGTAGDSQMTSRTASPSRQSHQTTSTDSSNTTAGAPASGVSTTWFAKETGSHDAQVALTTAAAAVQAAPAEIEVQVSGTAPQLGESIKPTNLPGTQSRDDASLTMAATSAEVFEPDSAPVFESDSAPAPGTLRPVDAAITPLGKTAVGPVSDGTTASAQVSSDAKPTDVATDPSLASPQPNLPDVPNQPLTNKTAMDAVTQGDSKPNIAPTNQALPAASAESTDGLIDVPSGAPLPIRQRRLFEFSAEAKFRAQHTPAVVEQSNEPPSGATSTFETEAAVQTPPQGLMASAGLAVQPAVLEKGLKPPTTEQVEREEKPTQPRVAKISRANIGDVETILQMQALQQRSGAPFATPDLQTNGLGAAEAQTSTAEQSQPELLAATRPPQTNAAPLKSTTNEAAVNATPANAPTNSDSDETDKTARRGGNTATNTQSGSSTTASAASTSPASLALPIDASPSDAIAAAFARANSPAVTLATEPATAARLPAASPIMPGEAETFDSVVSLRDAETAELQVGRGDERVKVILRERGEHIHVSAQTATPELAEALLSDANELGSSLENHGFDLASFEASTDEQADAEAEAESLNGPDTSQTMTQTVLHRRRIVA